MYAIPSASQHKIKSRVDVTPEFPKPSVKRGMDLDTSTHESARHGGVDQALSLDWHGDGTYLMLLFCPAHNLPASPPRAHLLVMLILMGLCTLFLRLILLPQFLLLIMHQLFILLGPFTRFIPVTLCDSGRVRKSVLDLLVLLDLLDSFRVGDLVLPGLLVFRVDRVVGVLGAHTELLAGLGVP